LAKVTSSCWHRKISTIDQTGIAAEQLLATPELVELLGGRAYVEAVRAWRAASLRWTRSRRRQKGQPPMLPR
jgi:hypothetical protein